MEMARYILSILRTQVSVVFSWGFHCPQALRQGLLFAVQGFLFTGLVKVVYDEGTDTFTVQCVEPDGTIKKERTEVYCDNLVEVIDELVERCPDYKERVRAEYGITSK